MGRQAEVAGPVSQIEKSGFPSALRIRASAEYALIFEHGKSFRHGNVIAYVRPGDVAGRTRMGTAVSKRRRTAVCRNRIRRMLREAFRLERSRSIPSGIDLVLLTPKNIRDLTLEATRHSLREIGRKAARHFGLELPPEPADA